MIFWWQVLHLIVWDIIDTKEAQTYETLVKNTMFTPKLKIFTYHDILVVGTTPRSVGYT